MKELDFKKLNGLIPAVVQDAQTKNVLMVGFMNEQAYEQTCSSGKVTFFSRTKNRLWTKGETSGNYLNVKEIREDCDGDTLLIKAIPDGPACHTGADTCFNENNDDYLSFIHYLENLIRDRKLHPDAKSYTSSLFAKGMNKIAQKVGEEAVEIVIESKDDNPDLFKGEAADLLFHLLVLFEAKNIPLSEVIEVLKKRHHTD